MTHDELVEKVARAIAVGLGDDYGLTNNNGRFEYDEAAQAALSVVRERLAGPTPEMLQAGRKAQEEPWARVWQAMLAASPLAEGRE